MKWIWLLPLLAAGCFGGSSHAAAPPSQPPPAGVVAEARSFAEGLGRPRTLQVVQRPHRASWLIIVTGDLVCGACSHPAGTPTITGHAASETWTSGGGATTMSVTEHPPALRPGVTVTAVPLLTRVVISYPVGPVRSRLAAQSKCTAQRPCRVEAAQPHFWYANVRRRLACGASPAGGYRDPARACRALHALAALWPGKPDDVCACPAILLGTLRAAVRGTVSGAHVDIPLDPCSLCGLGAGAEHAASLLTPR